MMKINTAVHNRVPRVGAILRLKKCIQDIQEGQIVLPDPEPSAQSIPVAPITKLAVSRKEAAELLSTSLRTFDRWVAGGLVRASGVGRKRIYAVSELQRFLKETSESIDL